MLAPIHRGGANMVSPSTQNTAVKIAWVQRLNNSSNATWKALINMQLPDLDKYLWSCNFQIKDIKYIFINVTNKFWIDIITAWSSYFFHTPHTKKDILDQQI